MREVLQHIHRSEEGHGILLSAGGVVALAIGAVNDIDWLTITGGAVAAFGYLAYDVLRHTRIDYDIYKRLEALENGKDVDP